MVQTGDGDDDVVLFLLGAVVVGLALAHEDEPIIVCPGTKDSEGVEVMLHHRLAIGAISLAFGAVEEVAVCMEPSILVPVFGYLASKQEQCQFTLLRGRFPH